MSDPKISVIVPIYNVEKFLRRCIDSILAQTYTNLEIILVDDGSPDGCPAICDEYAEKDDRIVVIHKENGGVSSARNSGLDNVSGDLIGWVDPDDYIEPDMFETLFNLKEKVNADISICSVNVFGLYENQIIYSDSLLSKEEYLKLLLSNKIQSFLWNKLFSKELFAGIKFAEGKTYEDVMVQHLIAEKAKNIVVSSKMLYNYRQWDKQITRADILRRYNECISALRFRAEFYKSTKFYKYAQLSELQLSYVLINEALELKIYNHDYDELLKDFRNNFFKCFSLISFFDKIKFFMFFCNPRLLFICKKLKFSFKIR